jgi:hypothetical protein
VRDLARKYGNEAIKGLLDLARDTKTPAAARVAAYNALLDRGYGKAKQSMELTAGFEFLDPQEIERRRQLLLAEIRERQVQENQGNGNTD